MGGSDSSMNMPGMSMGGGGAHSAGASQAGSTHGGMAGMAMSHAPGTHGVVNLLPEWLGVLGTILFVLVAVSHVRHLAMTGGQRAPWHACHVLMAVGMAFMYAPAALHAPDVPVVFWRSVFAVTGVLAALWALGDTRRAPNLIWLLTAVDLGAMVYMWSPGAFSAPLTWILVAYLTGEAGLWAQDAYRRLDGGSPVVTLGLSATGEASAVTVASPAASLIGNLDISASMITMTLGMAYMLAAMQIMS